MLKVIETQGHLIHRLTFGKISHDITSLKSTIIKDFTFRYFKSRKSVSGTKTYCT